MPLIEPTGETDLLQQWVNEYMSSIGFTPGLGVEPPGPFPSEGTNSVEVSSEPSARSGVIAEFLQSTGLGLNPLDPISGITRITDPTTPPIPTDIVTAGFDVEIGLAWHLAKPVGSNVRAVEIQRSTTGAFAGEEENLGEFAGYFWLDRNWPTGDGYGDSVTRYYRLRSVAVTADTVYFSAWSTAVSATTLAAGATNADLQTRIDTFSAQVQSRHMMPGAVELSDLASALIGLIFYLGGIH